MENLIDRLNEIEIFHRIWVIYPVFISHDVQAFQQNNLIRVYYHFMKQYIPAWVF